MRNISLSLFAFHLNQPLAETPDDSWRDRDRLWVSLEQLGASDLPFPSYLKNLRSHLVFPETQGDRGEGLARTQFLDLGYFISDEGFKIEGNLQPFRRQDVYAIDLTLQLVSAETEIAPPRLRALRPAALLPPKIEASLGQTLWLYAEVPPTADCDVLAQQCANVLLAGYDPVRFSRDRLFGSRLYDFRDEKNLPRLQVLVFLNAQQADTIELVAKGYDELRDLFCCHHKLSFIYQQARDRYPQAKQLYAQIEGQIQAFANLNPKSDRDLQARQTWLAAIPANALAYSRSLRELQARQSAIATNLANYRARLKTLQAIGETPQTWHDALATFRLWHAQIRTDINYLSPRQDLFAQFANALQGSVAIERAKQEAATARRNQHSERRLISIGIGLALGGVAIFSGAKPVESLLALWLPTEAIACPQAGLWCFSYLAADLLMYAAIATLCAGLLWLVLPFPRDEF